MQIQTENFEIAFDCQSEAECNSEMKLTMDFDTAWKIFEQLRGKQATVLCTDGDIVTGKLIDLMEEYDNEYDAIFLNTVWPGCVEIPLAEVVSISEAETAS